MKTSDVIGENIFNSFFNETEYFFIFHRLDKVLDSIFLYAFMMNAAFSL